MKPHEELLEQRDAVLFGTWVRRQPLSPGDACAVERVREHPIRVTRLSAQAVSYLRRAIRARSPRGVMVMEWNDTIATRQQVIDALDEAARMAKEAGE